MKSIYFKIAFFITMYSYGLNIEKNYNSIIFPLAKKINNSTTRIPITVVDQLILIDAKLFNEKGRFIIDTGAENLILNKSYFKASNSLSNSEYTRVGVHGELNDVKVKYIKTFKINDLDINRLNADVIDLSHFETSKKTKILGIIGQNILKDYEVFIDLFLNQITLSKIDKDGNLLSKKVYAEKISNEFPFKLKKHSIVVEAKINNKTYHFAIDTAAEFNQLNKKIGKDVLNYYYPSNTVKLSGPSGKTKTVLVGKLFGVKLNENIYFGPMQTILCNLKKLSKTFGYNIDGVLGFEFFKQKRTIINYKKRKLYFIDTPITAF